MTVIKYKAKWIWMMLVFGIINLSIGIFAFGANSVNSTLSLFAGIGVMYIVIFLFRWKRQLGSVSHEYIQFNTLPAKKIRLSQLKEAKKTVGDYLFKSQATEIRIDGKLVHEDSKKFLDQMISDFEKGKLVY